MSTVNHLGIDLSGDHLDLYLAGPDGRPLMPAQRFTHNQPGSRAARTAVLTACQTDPADQLAIGAEATGLLWWHLYHQWAADPQLADLHPVFYLLNPACTDLTSHRMSLRVIELLDDAAEGLGREGIA